jgi:hypothetical protein
MRSCATLSTRRQARLGGRGNPVDRDTMEGVPIVAHVAPQGAACCGGLGRTGQRETRIARCGSRQLPVGIGTGEAVSERRQWDVRDR